MAISQQQTFNNTCSKNNKYIRIKKKLYNTNYNATVFRLIFYRANQNTKYSKVTIMNCIEYGKYKYSYRISLSKTFFVTLFYQISFVSDHCESLFEFALLFWCPQGQFADLSLYQAICMFSHSSSSSASVPFPSFFPKTEKINVCLFFFFHECLSFPDRLSK